MSGGHWDYSGDRIRTALELITTDAEAHGLWPYTCEIIAGLAETLYEIEHGMDWHLSSDSFLDAEADKRMAGQLVEAVLKPAPDEWFPRGKWATIQAIQERMSSDAGPKA